ncbi:uncharacterized protein LOC124537553 [Vanessa cardui]|uniref:uncharacterized protein LOC124537553 n=1 Tax=Vanessa cardui TaxID=171605 RepID=UPI001F145E02|nr:uncharacterized protein LOC124537553 [Vanessa cardui]
MSQGKNLRIIGNYDCDTNIEKKIKNIEALLKIDFKSLSHWKDVIEKINAAQIEYNKKILKAKEREYEIIKKLYIENYRVSPFELSQKFARTANLWKELDTDVKKHKVPSKIEHSVLSLHNVTVDGDEEIVPEEIENKSNGHPNSEVVLSKDAIILKTEEEQDSKSNSPHLLPVNICTNPHKLLSSIEIDNYIALSYKESKDIDKDFKSDTINENLLNETKSVKCYPEKIIIYDNSLAEQFINFSLLNCSTENVYIRFKSISDASHFKAYRIQPEIPYKLNPGLTKCYKFNFTLLENINGKEISVILYFRIKTKTAEEILHIPIIGQFEKSKSVIVTKTVNIPQVYMWQVNAKCAYPKGIVQIQLCGNTEYDLYIRKKNVDFINEFEDPRSIASHHLTLATESLMQNITDVDTDTQKNTLLSSKDVSNENETTTSVDVVALVLNDILNLVYEPFIFKNTYFRLLPKSKRIVLVYFTKAKHVGYHHRYYEFMFCDAHDKSFTKTVKVFAEVLPHPILIHPAVLDMSQSPVIFGQCQDDFTIINTHKVFPVTIAIKTTHKMEKIFKIMPRVATVLPKSNLKFKVIFCKENINVAEIFDIMAYFTIKIIVNGDSSIYKNVPPFYYEIIAPCAREFIRIYQKQNLLNELSE